MAGLVAGAVAKAVATAVTVKAADKAIGRPKTPAIKPPPVVPDSETVKNNARREAALRFGAGGTGRASTVLSDNQRLGG